MRRQRNLVLFVLMLIIITIATPVQAKTKITLNAKKKTLVVGKTYTLKVKGTKKKVKWSSSKKSVATVSKKGKVKAKKAGTAIIKAKVAGKTLKCKIIVKKKTPAKKTTQSKTNTTNTSNSTTAVKPETTTTVKPDTPPVEPDPPVDENYKKLVDYINTNGSDFDDHMLAIRQTSSDGTDGEMTVIAYDSENKRVVFMYMVEGESLNQLSYMYIKSSSPDEKTNICHGMQKEDDSYVVLTSDFAKSTYEPGGFAYNIAEQTGAFAQSDVLRERTDKLFKGTESIFFDEWNNMLEPVGLTLKELGFSLIY